MSFNRLNQREFVKYLINQWLQEQEEIYRNNEYDYVIEMNELQDDDVIVIDDDDVIVISEDEGESEENQNNINGIAQDIHGSVSNNGEAEVFVHVVVNFNEYGQIDDKDNEAEDDIIHVAVDDPNDVISIRSDIIMNDDYIRQALNIIELEADHPYHDDNIEWVNYDEVNVNQYEASENDVQAPENIVEAHENLDQAPENLIDAYENVEQAPENIVEAQENAEVAAENDNDDAASGATTVSFDYYQHNRMEKLRRQLNELRNRRRKLRLQHNRIERIVRRAHLRHNYSDVDSPDEEEYVESDFEMEDSPQTSSSQEINEAAACLICLKGLHNSNQPTRLPCGHVVCLPCVRSWYNRSQSCPYCRQQIHFKSDCLRVFL